MNEPKPRCLVTGATGHLGAVLTRLLIRRGFPTAVLIRSSGNRGRLNESLAQVEVIEGTLPNIAPFERRIRKFAPDVIFHLAWSGVSRDKRNSADQIRVNVEGGLRLVGLAGDLGCRAFIGLGSQAEYGPSASPLNEETPPRPETAYGLAKLCLGQLTIAQCGLLKIPAVWLRLFAAYGPDDERDRLIPYLITTLLRGESPVLTSGTQHWDYLYIDDAAEAVLAAALQGSLSGTFNLAHGEAWTVRRIATFLRDHLAPQVALNWAASSSPSLRGSSQKFSFRTGWQPRVSMEEGLLRTVAWYREYFPVQRAAHL